MKRLKQILTSKIYSAKSKLLISTIFVVSSLCIPKVGFSSLGAEGFDVFNNILFPLSHANIFHLLCNLWCMWLIRPPYYLVSGIIISFLASFLPEPFVDSPIMGMSGILFAICGAKYGKNMNAKKLFKNMWLFFTITAFIPNVACLFHLYCLAIGFAWGYIKETYKIFEVWNTTKI